MCIHTGSDQTPEFIEYNNLATHPSKITSNKDTSIFLGPSEIEVVVRKEKKTVSDYKKMILTPKAFK